MAPKPPAETACELCNRITRLEFHHLIPRKVHRRTRFKKNYTREELSRGVFVCRPCHRAIHRFYDEMTLGTTLDTLDKLQASEVIQRHVGWISKQRVQ